MTTSIGLGDFNGNFTKKEYEKSLKGVIEASQKMSHLWSQAMGYIPDGKLPLFSMNGADYVLKRDFEGKMGLHYELRNDQLTISTPRLNLSYLAAILEKAYAASATNLAPEDLSDNFICAIEEPLERYRAIEPRKASRLDSKLSQAFR